MARHHGGEYLIDHAGASVLEICRIHKCDCICIHFEGDILVVILHAALLIYQDRLQGCNVAIVHKTIEPQADGKTEGRLRMLKGLVRAADNLSSAVRSHDENISQRRAEAPLALPCEESTSDREHVKVVETCAINGG